MRLEHVHDGLVVRDRADVTVTRSVFQAQDARRRDHDCPHNDDVNAPFSIVVQASSRLEQVGGELQNVLVTGPAASATLSRVNIEDAVASDGGCVLLRRAIGHTIIPTGTTINVNGRGSKVVAVRTYLARAYVGAGSALLLGCTMLTESGVAFVPTADLHPRIWVFGGGHVTVRRCHFIDFPAAQITTRRNRLALMLQSSTATLLRNRFGDADVIMDAQSRILSKSANTFEAGGGLFSEQLSS
jgi:hypothetical protein